MGLALMLSRYKSARKYVLDCINMQSVMGVIISQNSC